MSLHADLTKQEVEGLLMHGFRVGSASQLSDAFVLGMRYEQKLTGKFIKELQDEIEKLKGEK